ncbi:MAG: hypothetical protein KGZ74_18610 [Chitinophagaceae bacterium]|jgi:hypothetical protein|uniref:hypothetical protein n=1 Tax=Sediminibacterium sp. TaxID=1917865 RepID=UPI001BB9D2F2|nr:hypothetical protein [Chitinophagaceae bacterium]
MNERLKQQIMTQYPEWHYQPLRLTVAEIEAPLSVIGHFFECYTLPQIRACLKEMVFDAICMDDNDAPSHVTTQDDVEKLIEAAWLIHQEAKTKSYKIGNDNTASNQLIQQESDIESAQYKMIHDFFESFTLPQARGYLLSTLQAAESEHIWNKSTPNDLLFFFDHFHQLLSAIYDLTSNDDIIQQVVLPKSTCNPDLTQYHLYCGNYDKPNPWEYVPHWLSAKEYRDPYKALRKITKEQSLKEWKEILHYLLNNALAANSLAEMGVHLELIRISECLQKMLEACHLIHVRAFVNPNDHGNK